MNALVIKLHLEEPILATQPNAGEPNSATSYGFIPGSMIRGALVRLYQQKNQSISDLAVPDGPGHDLFFSGRVRYLNAYPSVSGSLERLLPTPISWFVEKDKAHEPETEISDFAVEKNESLEKPKKHKGEFCPSDGKSTSLFDSARQMNVHNASTDRNRKKQGESQVFRYEALAANQDFCAVILADNPAHLNDLHGLLGDALFLGGSHTGGYGHVQVTHAKIDLEWKEYSPDSGNSSTGFSFLTLLSDTVLPSQGLSIPKMLLQALGMKAEPNDVVADAYYQLRLASGYNRKWGTALAQAWAIQAGSVFKLKADAIPDIERILVQGIGERRAEGYGRLALNWHVKAVRKCAPFTVSKAPPKSTPLSPASQAIAHQMAERLLRSKLEENLIKLVTDEEMKFNALPSASQLNRIRVAAQQSILTNDVTLIASHIKNMASAKKVLQNARVNNAPFDQWVTTHSPMPEMEFRAVFGLNETSPTVAGVRSSLDSKLINEFSARLVDGVMKRAIEQARTEREGA